MTIGGEGRFDGSGTSYLSITLGAESDRDQQLLTKIIGFLNTTDRPGRLERLVELCDGITAEEETAADITF